MYICVCNAVNERAVRSALLMGAKTPGQVYSHLGVAPKCGKCSAEISEIMSNHASQEPGCSGCGKCGGCK